MDQDNVMSSAGDRATAERQQAGTERAGAGLWKDVLEQPQAGGSAPPWESVVSNGPLTPGVVKLDEIPEVATEDDVQLWLGNLLHVLTYAAAVAGLPVVGAAAYANYQADRVLLLSLWVALYLPLLVPLIWTRIPHSLHAATFIAVLSGAGILSFLQPGYREVGNAVLLCVPAFTATLWGGHAGYWGLAGAFVAAGAGSWLTLGQAPTSGEMLGGTVPFPAWWGSPLAVLLLGGALALAAGRLRRRTDSLAETGRHLTSSFQRLETRVEKQGEELICCTSHWRCIEDLGSLFCSTVEPDGVVEGVLETVSHNVPCYAVQVFLADCPGETKQGARRWRVSLQRPGTAKEAIRKGAAADGVVAWVADRRKPVVLGDVEMDGHYKPQPLLPETRSEAAFPLVVGSRLLGVLDVHATDRNAFSETDLEFLRAVARWLSLALDHRSLGTVPSGVVADLSRTVRRLYEGSAKVDVVDVIAETIAETGAGSCLVAEFVHDPDGNLESLLCLRSWRRQGGARPEPGTRLPVSNSLFPVDLLEGTWVASDVALDDRLSTRAKAVFGRMGVRAFAGFPLRGKEACFGQVLVLYAEPEPFSDSVLRLFGMLEDHAGLALEQVTRLDEAKRRARAAELSTQAAVRLHESMDIAGVLSTAVTDIARTLDLAAVDVRLGLPPAVADRTGSVWEPSPAASDAEEE